jgi:bifunctional DNase/RNase
MDIIGLSTSPASGGAYALILKESMGNRRLPIIIGAFEAQAIALELEGIVPPRPMTHDLLKNVIETLGTGVTEVLISELRNGTFFARIYLDTPVTTEIDARPSDAIALSVRFGAPIYVTEEVLDEAGYLPDESEGEEGPAVPNQTITPESQSADQLTALQEALREAIQREDYEEAARLRDVISRMQKD